MLAGARLRCRDRPGIDDSEKPAWPWGGYPRQDTNALVSLFYTSGSYYSLPTKPRIFTRGELVPIAIGILKIACKFIEVSIRAYFNWHFHYSEASYF